LNGQLRFQYHLALETGAVSGSSCFDWTILTADPLAGRVYTERWH
jgi:hypothetical protein